MSKLTRVTLYQDLASVSDCIETGKLSTPDVWHVLFISAVWPLSSAIIYLYACYEFFVKDFTVDTSLIFILSNMKLTLLIVMLLISCCFIFFCAYKVMLIYCSIDKALRKKSVSLRHLEKRSKQAALVTFLLNLALVFMAENGYDIFLSLSPFIILLLALLIVMSGTGAFIRFGLAKALLAIFSRVMILSEIW
ncbi:hypothetical protein IW01_20335 [Pectobacterium brasiliense]|uniref:hypothetical protein n=1 Tax=Pectobacterium brasiliense TaxID=180957 RepID=UPI0004E6C98B|nr:hypothetical protein [Pectobacterium brasiliense]KFF61311.1 hypothetical protein IW01_20335 [Pectobacterium brasiliense]